MICDTYVQHFSTLYLSLFSLSPFCLIAGFKDRFDMSSKVPDSATEFLPYGDAVDHIMTASLSLNGHQRWPVDMPSIYFRTSVPYTSWRTMPSTNIYSYAFALEAATWQPTS